ncbi:MAG: DUF370 domain-containing protein [Oscillospiraceae bacterium]|jgi:regulator of extracellular matrix RemA (YlzA/DUF370 family)|nr:DUF370 domain-containing protein [Oscillospiraceae bacterium]
MQLVNIGFGNLLNGERVLAVLQPDSQPVKRLAQEAKAAGTLVDASCGRRTRAVLLLDSGHTVLSYLQTETIASRMHAEGATEVEEEDHAQ